MVSLRIYRLVCFLLLFSIIQYLQGQTYPVQTTLFATPPSSVYLSDYANPSFSRLVGTVNLMDENEPSLDVQFNLTIEGNGILLQTDPNANLPVITLMSGPNQFTGYDLRDYLDPVNMLVSGIDKNELINSGALPEGMYNFCLEVTDYLRDDKQVGLPGCVMVSVQLNNPPNITHPKCGGVVAYTEQQGIPIAWHSNHDPAIRATYRVKMVHVPKGMDPNQAIQSSDMPLIDDYSTMMTQMMYGPDFPELDYGETYAFRVDVEDAMGHTTFENEGLGEVCVFTYASDSIGFIPILEPDQDAVFSAKSPPVFSWNGPANAHVNDHVHYKLAITQIGNNQTAEVAMHNNLPIFIEESEIVTQVDNWSMIVDTEFDPETDYAWQVEAYIGENKIAASQVNTFHTAALIDHFKAAEKLVQVLELTNNDLNNLSGRGQIQLEKDGDWVPITFSGVQVESFQSTNILQSGTIDSEIENGFDLTVKSDENGEVVFEASHIVLTPRNLKLRGHAEWTFPLACLSENGPVVLKTESQELYFDAYELQGDLKIEESNLQLIDPHGFEMHLENTSLVKLGEESNILELDGHVKLPEGQKGKSSERIFMTFSDINSPLYFEASPSTAEEIVVDKELNLSIRPTKVIVDFDINRSPQNLGDHHDWMGVYFEKFDYLMGNLKDVSHQVDLDDNLIIPFDLTDNSNFKGWVGDDGLDVLVNKESGITEHSLTFNDFDGQLNSVKLHIENNSIQDGSINGEIVIPLFNNESFTFTVNMHAGGLATGHLDEDLTGYEVKLAANSEGEAPRLHIKQAVFKDQSHLDIALGLILPGVELQSAGNEGIQLTDISLYGDGYIDQNGSSEMQPLAIRYEGNMLDGFPIVIDSIAVSYFEGHYLFAAGYGIQLGPDISSISGEMPRSILVASGHEEHHEEEHHDDDHHGHEKKKPNWFKINDYDVSGEKPTWKIGIPALTFNWGGSFVDIEKLEMKVNETYGWCIEGKGQVSLRKMVSLVPNYMLAVHVIVGAKNDFVYSYGAISLGKINETELALNPRLKRYIHHGGDHHEETMDGSGGLEFPGGFVRLKAAGLRFFINMKRELDHETGTMEIVPDHHTYGGGGLLGFGVKKGSNDDFIRLTVGGDFTMNVGRGIQHISGFISAISSSELVEGKFVGSVDIDFESSVFIFEAEVELEKKVCVEAEVEVEYNWDTGGLDLVIGSNESPIKAVVIPEDPSNLCNGMTAMVYFEYHPEVIYFGFGIGYQWSFKPHNWYGIPDVIEVKPYFSVYAEGMVSGIINWGEHHPGFTAVLDIKGGLDLTIGYRILGSSAHQGTIDLVHVYIHLQGALEVPVLKGQKCKASGSIYFEVSVLGIEAKGEFHTDTEIGDPFAAHKHH